MGMRVEREHTSDSKITRKIALDHLREDPCYYTKLAKMERGFDDASGCTKKALVPVVKLMNRIRDDANKTKNPKAYERKINKLYDIHEAVKERCGAPVAKRALFEAITRTGLEYLVK